MAVRTNEVALTLADGVDPTIVAPRSRPERSTTRRKAHEREAKLEADMRKRAERDSLKTVNDRIGKQIKAIEEWLTENDTSIKRNLHNPGPYFLHHYDVPTCTTLLAKVAGALKPGGRIAVLEFVPNDDRVSPPMPAAFALQMLAGTEAGNAYTLRELTGMLQAAGFGSVTAHPLQNPQTLVVATK